jgi:putative ABC transport system permease protein
VAIARAVVGDRRLLLADEPSGALDSVNAEEVMRLIHTACKRGVAAIVVTHDAQLASWADRVVFLRDGHVVDQTSPPPGRRPPISARLALRDLARYRARAGSALAAITLGVLIAVLICILSAQRFGNVLDYAGPNLTSNQLIVYTPNGQGGPGFGPGAGPSAPVTGSEQRSWAAAARGIAASLGSHDIVQLDGTSGYLQHAAAGRQFGGPVYVATPQLLRAFGIKASQVDPTADILTMRPGLSGISRMQLVYGNYSPSRPVGPGRGTLAYPCPKSDCLANPVIQEVSALPSGTSAPNTVITEHAIRALGLHAVPDGWLIQSPNPPTAGQITSARVAAAAKGMSVETKSSIPSSSEIINWATVFGIVLALGILAMTIGLIRSETASDLRTLTATGASSWNRRALTAVTAGALALTGAVLGTVMAYAATLGWSWDNQLDGLSGLSSVPIVNLLIILVGMPLFAAAGGWLLAGHQPRSMARQPIG